MALDAQHLRDAWHNLVQADPTLGQFSKADLLAAATAIDAWFDTNAASINAALPQPFKTAATLAQKTSLTLAVARARANGVGG